MAPLRHCAGAIRRFGDFDGLSCGPAQAHQAVGDHRRHRQGARAQGGRPQRDRARRRRAGLRHARQHQAGGDQGDPRAASASKYTNVDGIAELKDAVRARSSSARTASTTSRRRSRSAPAASRCCTTPSSRRSTRATRSIIPAPYWVSYPDMVLLAGGEPVEVVTTMASRLQDDGRSNSSARSRRRRSGCCSTRRRTRPAPPIRAPN